MPMMTVSPADVERAKVRTLSADHCFYDADDRVYLVGTGETLLQLGERLVKYRGRYCTETRVLALVGGALRLMWTLGKLVAWERA